MKHYVILNFLFIFTVNLSYGQVGPYLGGLTCASAIPIEAGEGYITNNILGDDWYYFIAPCDGELEVTNCAYGDNKQIIIYSGDCGSLTIEKTANWDDCSTNDLDGGYVMLAGETVFIQMDDTWDEDDIQFDIVFENPECPLPTSVDCLPIAWDEILIAWYAGGGETEWRVIYGPSGFDPDVEGETLIVSGAATVALTGLAEFTCYDYYIVPDCGVDIVSCLGTPYSCCTPEMCAAPSLVTPTSITSESFSLNWYFLDEAVCYDIEWGLEGFVLGTGTFVECLLVDNYDFTDLEAYECYAIYIRANCGVGIYSSWGGPFNVCTEVDSADLNIKGTVYFDENENGIRDIGEIAVNMASIQSDPEGVLCFTGIDGQYVTSTLYVGDGVYEIHPFWEDQWSVSSDSLFYTIVVDADYEPRDSLDFGLYPDTLIYKVDIEFNGGYPRCNDTINYWLNFQNSGTTIASGLVHLTLDDSLYYVSADVLPDSIVGQHVYWNYEDLFYFADELITVQVGTPDGLADTVLSTLTVTVDSADVELYSTVDELLQIIVCGYDPNDKTPTPLGIGEYGHISPDTESIEYLVRFQNTGTDTAFNVVIRDQLDPNVNWYSLTPLASSHDLSLELSPDGEVSFRFNGIMLPDSNVNEAASHGFVKYKVKLEEGLPLGTSIYNTANIYFDFNPAVVTNTTLNTLYLDDVSIEELINAKQIVVYPNPFSATTTVYFGDRLSENSTLQIIDLLGNQVYFLDRLTVNSIEIDASNFDTGIYIIVLQDVVTSEIYTKKIVVN